MLSYRILLRQLQNKSVNPFSYKCLTQSYCNKSSNNKNEDQNDLLKKEEAKRKSEEALKKLNVLLKQMIEDDTPVVNKSELKLARPKSRKVKIEPGIESTTTEPVEKQIVTAAKDVAESLGGNVKKTESELLAKLLNSSSQTQDDKLTTSNLSNVISGMKIIPKKVQPVSNETSRAQQVKKILKETGSSEIIDKRIGRGRISKRAHYGIEIKSENIKKVDLFGSEPLKIFTSKQNELTNEQVELKTWNELQKRSLRLAVTHPPANYFQEIILWTEQGKVWKFPIDNEQGMEEEQNVSFAEHIFLEKHLEPWCPPKGPIRHFMELVCVGLSKNYYITVEAKKDHIFWFRDYFQSKKELLEEIGAIPAANTSQTKEITDK